MATDIFKEFSDILADELSALSTRLAVISDGIERGVDRIRMLADNYSEELSGRMSPDDGEPTGLDIILPARLKCLSTKRDAVLRAFDRYGVSPELIEWMGENLNIVAMRNGRVLVDVNLMFVLAHKAWLIEHGILQKDQARHIHGSRNTLKTPIHIILSAVLACLKNDPGKAADLGWEAGEPGYPPPIQAFRQDVS
ncbi:hypothetical protein DSCO28_07720 [Desulfosarcina ovata subsp. sediminis]|uniref:Uncharacterized protein n=1 Tax=Desulfosarcina ovata subsp. sediminis TaxID=885957 RepID=A0A5K7ZGU7_9BACT|nr:hypothetical protein [Desulfosarcina ovata]BBO80206.1 hypothetical protein DSCO28_07720 [Desulfosarcina ovata subsp. sediminis]